MSSSEHVTLERLVAYFAGELAVVDARTLEEHSFECDACGVEYSIMGKVVARVRSASRRGLILFALNAEILTRLRDSGLRVIERHATPGGGLHVPVTPDIDLMVGYLSADLRGVRRVDVAFEMDHGTDLEEDVPVDSEDGIMICCTRHLFASGGSGRSLCRVYAADDPERRIIAEYQLAFTVS